MFSLYFFKQLKSASIKWRLSSALSERYVVVSEKNTVKFFFFAKIKSKGVYVPLLFADDAFRELRFDKGVE